MNRSTAAGAQSNHALVLHNEPYADSVKTYKRICDNLRTSVGGYTEGEAMAGLFVVSAFLFRGGRGAWQQFLAVAADWVWTVLHMSVDPAETILHCSDSQQFVIKTTFWFDILASTTRLEPPRFIHVYRKLWTPRSAAYIEGAAVSASSSSPPCCCSVEGGGTCCAESQTQPALSMMSVMGCENVTALAIAETSALACWKEAQVRQGTLSVPELVDRGRAIEAECLSRIPPPSHAHSCPHSHAQYQHQHAHQQHLHAHAHAHAHHPHGAGPDGLLYPAHPNTDLAAKRRLTADIFRATARVYLHSVISGEHPGCPEIHEGVRETIEILKRVPAGNGNGNGNGDGNGNGGGASTSTSTSTGSSSASSSSVARSVLRSVVFGICLCGCLADDPADREFLLRRLDAEEKAEGVGNCASARSVMQEVWRSRAAAVASGSNNNNNNNNGGGGGNSGGSASGGGASEVLPLSWREATQQYGGESLLLV